MTGLTTKWKARTVATSAEWGRTTPFGIPNFKIIQICVKVLYFFKEHKNFGQWQCSILVTWYTWQRYCTAIGGSTNYSFWYNFDTVLYQFLETGTSDRRLICIVQRLRFSGFSLYPFHFSFTVHLRGKNAQVTWFTVKHQLNNFNKQKHGYLIHTWSDKPCKDTSLWIGHNNLSKNILKNPFSSIR